MLDTIFADLDPSAVAIHLAAWAPKALTAVALLVLFAVLAWMAQRSIYRALGRARMHEGARAILARFARYTVLFLGALTVLDQLGVDVTTMVAGLGIAGLAISFAAQDTLANLIAGVTLLLDRPFRAGDWVSMGDQHATVSEMRLRTTVLTTFDNETIVVPNKTLATERIVNYTLTRRARMRVNIGIAYKEDVEAARRILLGLLEGDERLLTDPEPVVVVTGLGASSVDLQLRFWTEDPWMKFPLSWEYTEKGKKALDAAGIQIPFPHLQLFVEDTEGVRQLAGGDGARA